MTRKQAIRAKCLDCCGGSRAEVKRCESEDRCKLWRFRLGTPTKIDSGAGKAAKYEVLDTISDDGCQEAT